MIWWPLFFIGLLNADDLSIEKYCFSSIEQVQIARSQFKSISVPIDRLEQDNTCLIVSTRPHRRELIQRFLRSNHPDMTVSFSSENMQKEHCNLKVEKITNSESSDQQISLNRNSTAGAGKTSVNTTETSQITTLRDFELSVDQDSIQGQCRFISPQRYEITIKVAKNLKPIIPPVPPGTIVVVTGPPPDQQTSSLQTQIQLTPGSRIEIGGLVKKLKTDSRDLDASPKIKVGSDEKSVQEKVYLSIY